MFNQFSGALEIRLSTEPEMMQTLPHNIKANERVNSCDHQGISTADYYLHCEDRAIAEIALEKFKDFYKGQYLAVGDESYPASNELIENLNTAIQLAKEEIKSQSYFNLLSLFQRHPDKTVQFTNKNQELKTQLILQDGASQLKANYCTSRTS